VTARHANCCGNLVGGARETHRDRPTDRNSRVTRVQRELERLGARTARTDCRLKIDEKVGEASVV